MALEFFARADGPIPLGVDFAVGNGEILALVGHSGSGKTTVLRTIAGLHRPTNGRVVVDGEVWLDTSRGVFVPTHRRRVGQVFQSYALFPHMTARGNVEAAMGDLAGPERREEARRLLGLVGMGGYAERRPAELSGGQQQRIAIARAIARKPAVLLLDEPFAAVDRATREILYRELRALRTGLSMPIVLVTHDLDEARLLADAAVVIDKGIAVAQGAIGAVMADAGALRALGLREAGATIRARIEAHEADGLTRLSFSGGVLLLPRIDAAEGSHVHVGVPAHDVVVASVRPQGLSALNILPAVVRGVIRGDGPGVILKLAVGDDLLLARVTRRSEALLGLAEGSPCFAIVKSLAVTRDRVVRDNP